ncbi:ATP-binding protein [Actinokineospora auranticolor]|uniref:histidine kinase n=1 Tax=Actinokineospora auranticolor TaxID=155976 RepID=A0A2S6H0U5_9PSEU|nr:sensor histidine kinase [Actinokineospora auranticolor]PPK71061.1 phospho-acceptor domain-containing protein [Actinokineospora auranticolor]
MNESPVVESVGVPPVPEVAQGRWSLRQRWVAASVVVVLVLIGSIVGVAIAIADLSTARARLLDRIGPAVVTTQRLETAAVDQETGLRGFVLSRRDEFLIPYGDGFARYRAARDLVAGAVTDIPHLGEDLAGVDRALNRWRADYADPAIAAVGSGAPVPTAETGRQRFDDVRAALSRLVGDIEVTRAEARGALNDSASRLALTCVIALSTLLVVVVGAVISFTTTVVRPLSRLTDQVRRVADGQFGHEVTVAGPREIASLGHDVDAMRRRIVDELDQANERNSVLDATRRELERSNAELEQFAYIASHDLQEPLRKVASFCQLLERRYADKLDDNARQYIGFAVDGAKRMQGLINDLLAFSRVGRHTTKHRDLDATTLATQATRNLADSIENAGATVTIDPLPTIRGESPLLTSVFQNLIGNAVKFRGTTAPEVHLSATREADHWTFSVTDNGIGIDPQFADRVFAIFQRLHTKETYPGTGIGLAMCRKIIEHHGGTIHLDTAHTPGTRMVFTLPAVDTSSTVEQPTTDPETAPPDTAT